METKTYAQKLDALQYEVEHFLSTEFHNITNKKKSKHKDCKVLRIRNQTIKFDLGEGKNLAEYNGHVLIDAYGYEYNLSVLELWQLCALADAIKKRDY